MRLIFISDTHGLHNHMTHKLPKGNVLIHCGDATNVGTEDDIKGFVNWFQNIKGYDHKIFIAGNHDIGFEKKEPWLYDYINDENLLQSDCTYLEDDEYIIESPEFSKPIKFYGSPWQPRFFDWAFNVDRGKIHKHWEKIPIDTNVLITHGPPNGIRDLALYTQSNQGCTSLRYHVLEKIKPVIHAFGHIHEDNGSMVVDNTLFVNAAICTRRYMPINKPIIVKLFEHKGQLQTKILKR